MFVAPAGSPPPGTKPPGSMCPGDVCSRVLEMRAPEKKFVVIDSDGRKSSVHRAARPNFVKNAGIEDGSDGRANSVAVL